MWLLLLGLHCGVVEAILVNSSRSAEGKSKSDVYNGTESGDQLVPHESHQRSVVYGGYYPDETHGSIEPHSYGYDHGYSGYYPHHHHEPHHHIEPHIHHDSGLKALLIPLAGVALLGAAAVFAHNPILLQLGVISGKRKRRAAELLGLTEQRLKDLTLLEKFMSQLPKEEVERQERRLLASYLSCSGDKGGSTCVERLSCMLQRGPATQTEQQIMDMVISEIINNEFIHDKMKKSIVRARKIGLLGGDCNIFPCAELEETSKVMYE